MRGAGRSLAQEGRERSFRPELAGNAMSWLAVLFWVSAACVFYTYAIYPLLLALAARLRPVAALSGLSCPEVSVSVVLAAHNEEARIGARIRELAGLVAARRAGGEVIVVSDGSTDRTTEVAR